MLSRSSVALAFAALGGMLLLSGCQEVPVTGRSAISLVDDKAINERAAVEFDRIKSTQRASRNAAQIRVVQDIGARISRTVFWDVPHADWEFVVFHAPGVINAFAMPGGKVGVYSGLVDFCENEDQLASVIAHEIAHVAARHTHERFSQQMLLQPVGMATSIGVGTTIGGTGVYMPSVGGAVGSASGSGLTAITQSAFDREKEFEADHIGLMYMARAGYDPRESLRLLERLEEHIAAQGGPTSAGWLATHPALPQRQIQLNDLMDEAMEIYERGEIQSSHTIIE